MTRLGPFELRERIGVGGMGEVWRASHPDGGEVAVKTVAGGGSTEAWRARFRREVQAVAALEHPAIVAVLDANTTDESTWLAMELVTGGTLATNAPADWEGIRAVLLRLLSGLAHAHARGIVHRDLKPSNVLFGGPDDARPGWKLADFGIAHRAEQSDTDAYHGSPSFMAPEQVRGLWRSFGPWTDLYSLGCIAWQLLTGEPPFTGPTVEVAYGHLTLEPGRLPRGTVAVPGMDAWLARCLAKHPSQRFQRAEDAARQLRSTGDPAAVEVVGLPTSLPAPAEPEPKAVLGVGLGLYALRTRRIVGRDLEQRRLWEITCCSETNGTTEVILLRGASGAGKSALAQWLCEEVHVHGGASWVARHERDAARDGLAVMLRAAFGVTGLQRTELAEHLAAWGQRRDCRISELGALLERLTPAAPSDPPTALPRFALTAPDARNEAVTQALRMISGPRATVVWLDDLQWADSALEWAAAQLGKPGPLIVATVQDEALVEAPTRSAVEALAERAGVTVYDVGPLAQDQWPALVQGLLGLSGELALRVEDRTRGNPLFATQLVGDWVSRGLMEPTPRGFRLRPGATVELPDSLGQIWQLRIERLLEGVDSSGRDAMMVAALLGDVVGQEEWQACCLEAEVRPGAAPVDRAMKAWLLHPATDGWQFVHGMFREALLQKVDPARLAELNHACARALVALADGLELSERVARHLLAGPSKRDALEPLWKGAMHRQRNRDLRGAGAILDERDALLVTLDVPPSDPAWPEGWVQRARLRCVTGDSAGSLPMLMRAVDHAREHGWNIWLARGAILAVGTLGFAGRVSEALALMQDLRVHLSADEDLGALADAHAMILIYQRRHDDALAVLNTALKRSLSPFTQLGLWNRVLGAHAFRGDLAAAQTAYGEVMKLAEQTGEAVSGANAEEAMGILYHLRADYERALTHYRSGQETMVKVGGRAPNLELNECLALTLLGRFDEVEPRLVAVEEVTPADYTSRWGYLVGMRTRIAAAQGDYSELEVLVARWETLIEAVDLVDSDLALFAESAAAEASERGLSEPADRLRLIAARQRAGLG